MGQPTKPKFKKHKFRRVSGVLSVQGLDQAGDCESRLLPFQFLITSSRLGELSILYTNYGCVLSLFYSHMVYIWYELHIIDL